MNETALIAGVDEAGRGPLAGPVTAAAVILDPARPIPDLADSKRLTPSQREALDQEIRERALAFAVAWATVEEIDRINILQASLLAMQRAVENLGVTPPARPGGRQPPPPACLPGGDGGEGRCHRPRHQRRLHSSQGRPRP